MLSVTCHGEVRVPLPLEQTLPLFTAEGERRWVPGWEPRYPAPVLDDTEPGVVWLTESGHGPTHWVVAARTESGFTYARVVPGLTGGIVHVEATAGFGATVVSVTYRLTALSADAEVFLEAFASDFDSMLGEWQRLLDAWCAEGDA